MWMSYAHSSNIAELDDQLRAINRGYREVILEMQIARASPGSTIQRWTLVRPIYKLVVFLNTALQNQHSST